MIYLRGILIGFAFVAPIGMQNIYMFNNALSNKMSKVYCKNFKKLLIRRIDGVKEITTTATPVNVKRKLMLHSYNNTSVDFNTPLLRPLGHKKNNHSSIMNRSDKLLSRSRQLVKPSLFVPK